MDQTSVTGLFDFFIKVQINMICEKWLLARSIVPPVSSHCIYTYINNLVHFCRVEIYLKEHYFCERQTWKYIRKMEAFFGSWRLAKKENYDEYLTAIGEVLTSIFLLINRNILIFFFTGNVIDLHNDTIKPIETFYQDGEHFGVTIKNSHYTRDVRFKLNETFVEDTKDGRLCHVRA